MSTRFMRVLISVFQIILIVLLIPSRSAAECYSYCSECAKHLGGSGVAGPYSSRELCEQYVAKMRAEGFPFSNCQCDSGGQLSMAIPTGLYELEQDITFNVLDYVVLDPDTGRITLIGHFDERYKGVRVPYLQHLAELLEHSTPEFTLTWTPESDERIEKLFRRMDSDEELRKMAYEWGKWLDDDGRVTSAGRHFMPLFGVKPMGGSWQQVDRYVIVEDILRAVGNPKGALVIEKYTVLSNIFKSKNQEGAQAALLDLLGALGKIDYLTALQDQVRRGEITEAQFLDRLMRSIPEGMDEVFGLRGSPVTNAYDRARRRGVRPEEAFDIAIAEINRQFYTIMNDAMQTLFRRYDEVSVPPEVVYSTVGIRPEVAPEYFGVDPVSQLARVMFESDYISKFLINMPEINKKISRYKTEFSFEHDHPNLKKSFGMTSSHRLWISIERIDLAQSKDGYTIETRGTKMRFNIREIGSGGKNLLPTPGGYEELLTSIYDDLAEVFPVLHELRECAKLAAVSNWLKAKKPGITLPKAGRSGWASPARVPGAVFISWTPNPRPGAAVVAIRAMGGVSLVPPVGPAGPVDPSNIMRVIPVDSSVVDLRNSSLTAVPEIFDNAALSKILRRKIEVPVPRPVGWVASATKGDRTLKALSVTTDLNESGVSETREVHRKLEKARGIAYRLMITEHAVNAINMQNPNRQAEFEEMERKLVSAREEFVQSAIDITTRGLLNAHAVLREKYSYRRIGALAETADEFVEAKKELDKVESKLKQIENNLKRVSALTGDDMEKGFDALLELEKELISKGKFVGKDPLSQALRPIQKSFRYLNDLEDVIKGVRPFVILESARRRIKVLGPQTERELAALRDKLLPLMREQSDQLDEVLKDPEIRKLVPQ